VQEFQFYQIPENYQNFNEIVIFNHLLPELPVWLSFDCYNAMLKYACSSIYLKPTYQSLQDLFLQNNLTKNQTLQYLTQQTNKNNLSEYLNFNLIIPSYPSAKICEDYELKCHDFFKHFPSYQNILTSFFQQYDCDNKSGFHYFPYEENEIASIDILLTKGNVTTLVIQSDAIEVSHHT
jgi:hypothetical protein